MVDQKTTIDDLIATCVSQIPWPLHQVMETRLRYVLIALHGCTQQRQDAYAQQAGLIRHQTIELVNIQLKKSDKVRDPRKFWPFPWEEPETDNTELPTLTPQQQQEHLQRLMSFIDKSNE